MNLISQLFLAILTTTFTGSLAFWLWKRTKDVCVRWNPDLVYLILKLVCLLYLVPVGYVWMQLTLRHGYVQTDDLWQLNFSFAGILWILGSAVVLFWIYLTIRCIVECTQSYIAQKRIYCYNVPEEDVAVIQEFLRIKKKLKIRRNIHLYRNCMISSPGIMGAFCTKILLPDREYSKEQLTVIFHHELMHYKSGDPFFKLCGKCVASLQHLNPIAKDLMGWIDEWSELQCDVRAVAAISDELNAGRYFEMIVESMERPTECAYEDYIFSGLYESQVRLERRIEYMKKYSKIKKVAKNMTALCAFAFMMVSATTTYAAGAQLADAHDYVYQNVEITNVDTNTSTNAEEELEEIYVPASQDTSYEEIEYDNSEMQMISPLLDSNTPVAFQWSVDPGVRHVSSSFYVSAGQTICVSALATPGGNSYWIGIQDGWNNVRYVEGTDSLSHSFAITSSGSYRVLVQNRSSVTITATGAYSYY